MHIVIHKSHENKKQQSKDVAAGPQKVMSVFAWTIEFYKF